jgi:hypothetical protein
MCLCGKNINRLLHLAFSLTLISLSSLHAQNKTMQPRDEADRNNAFVHKAMLIPFELRLYRSDLDHKINAETKMTYLQIRDKFRDGMNSQLYKAFKTAKFGVLDLMDDTVKFRKEIGSIYQHLAYDYQKVPDQEHYSPPKKDKEKKKIQRGQLTIETKDDQRFMNARLRDPELVPSLYGRYKTDVFVFVNQLDLLSGMVPGQSDYGQSSPNRKIVVHYTVYSNDAKEINSGIAEEEFSPELNDPNKIIGKHFSKVAALIVERVNKGLGLKVTQK